MGVCVGAPRLDAGGSQRRANDDRSLRHVASFEADTRVRVDVEHPIMRAGWESILHQMPDVAVVQLGETNTLGWDLTFVDLDDSGFADAVDHSASATPVLAAVGDVRSSELLPHILDGRVQGVVSAEDSADDLRTAVAATARGHLWVSAPLTWILTTITTDSLLSDRQELTARELELARMLLAGATNADIAEAHDISISTVKFHVSNIMRKLGVCRRSQIAYALNKF